MVVHACVCQCCAHDGWTVKDCACARAFLYINTSMRVFMSVWCNPSQLCCTASKGELSGKVRGYSGRIK